ncbi:MAG TPA: efflux RND transporter permease subunit, partial [Leptospiraceae bacterium]|nr:efflux RND transporter permease subunit [Leptospiraceae bacterium]
MSKLEKGFAGKLAEQFINSRLTPVIAIVSILLGLMSVYLTPKEEEPQISVPMIDIQIFAPGFEAKEVERKVTEKVERAVWGLDGVEYVYSATKAHGSIITVRFKVGEPTEPSLVKVHHKLMEIRQDLPSNVLPPKISSFTIDDVPFLTLSFSSSERDDYDLRKKIAPLARELSSTPDLSRVELLGGRRESIRIILDPVKASNQGVSVLDVANTLKMSDAYFPMGKTYSKEKEFQVEVGGRLSSSEEVGNLAIGQRGGSIVRLKDIAKIQLAAEERNRLSILYDKDNGTEPKNAVSIVFAKRKGTNVVVLAKDLMERAETFTKDLPADIKMSIVRNYGTTAEEKSFELIEHLLIATISVTVLIALVMGLRSAIVVSIAIPVTLALTLAIYYFMGYTLNRVTLFALIFSIGILVDDAIVVVENVERHLHLDPESGILKATINAVSEVGNPTILATFTVIAAILPMAFVQGLMGPYMKPIPVGASLAMILSLFVAFIVTPWASVRLLKQTVTHHSEETPKESFLDKLYISFSEMLLGTKKAAFLFGIISIILLLSSFSFIYFKWVKVKMLPFDNKNEFQITIDYPPDTPLEKSVEWSKELSAKLLQEKEVKKIQIYAGESAPFSFSGMVKHTFLRKEDYMNDLQILLSDKGKRKESSHKIIERLRPIIQEFGKEKNAITKVLEIPPGPPVMATMVAEVYGPTEEIRRQVAKEIYSIFEKEKSVVDLDYSWRESKTRKVYDYDQIKGGILGAKSMQVVGVGSYIFTESNLASLAEADAPEETNVVLSVDNKVRSSQIPFQGSKIASFESGVIPVDSLLKNPKLISNEVLHRKNLKPVSYVLSELSGAEEAPVYGMLKLAPNIN